MAKYIKANPLVVKYLQLENDRNKVSDGNYLLWQADMLKFGPLTQLQETLAKIGGISLAAHEAREEQDGTTVRPLPRATDPSFIVETTTSEESEAETTASEESEAETTASEESEAETTASEETNTEEE